MPSPTAMPIYSWSSIRHQLQNQRQKKGRNENVSALFPFWLVFILARFVQFTASQTVVGRLAYLTVMPAFVIRSTIPSPE